MCSLSVQEIVPVKAKSKAKTKKSRSTTTKNSRLIEPSDMPGGDGLDMADFLSSKSPREEPKSQTQRSHEKRESIFPSQLKRKTSDRQLNKPLAGPNHNAALFSALEEEEEGGGGGEDPKSAHVASARSSGSASAALLTALGESSEPKSKPAATRESDRTKHTSTRQPKRTAYVHFVRPGFKLFMFSVVQVDKADDCGIALFFHI